MAEAVYGLCALTSLGCAVLLVRAYQRSRVKLLMASSLCFAGLTVNNVLLFVDLAMLPEVDLSVARSVVAFVAVLVLVVGALDAVQGPPR